MSLTIREKRIKSGPILEVEIYPITIRERNKSRAKKTKEARKEQRALNRKNSIKSLVRMVNVNFTNEDLFAHFTYSDENRPENEEQAIKDVQNYIERLSRHRKKKGLEKIKYIALIERDVNGHIHHHMFMSGMDRDEAEKIWGKGRCNIDRLQPDEFGYEAAARYISKDSDNSKRRMQSRNLKFPEVEIRDSAFKNQKAVERFILSDNREIEKRYPGYVVSEIRIEMNPVTGLPGFNIKMRRIE